MRVTRYEAGIAKKREIQKDKEKIRDLHKKGMSLEQIHRKTGRGIWFIQVEIELADKAITTIDEEKYPEEGHGKKSLTLKTERDQDALYRTIMKNLFKGISLKETSERMGRYPGYCSGFMRRYCKRKGITLKIEPTPRIDHEAVASEIKRLLKRGETLTSASVKMGKNKSYASLFKSKNPHLFQ